MGVCSIIDWRVRHFLSNRNYVERWIVELLGSVDGDRASEWKAGSLLGLVSEHLALLI